MARLICRSARGPRAEFALSVASRHSSPGVGAKRARSFTKQGVDFLRDFSVFFKMS